MAFSNTAKEKMIARSSNSHNKVGSILKRQNPNAYENYEPTDCITFVLNVLKETYNASGQSSIAKALQGYGEADRGEGKKFYGDLLAKALVQKHNWKAIYLTPDQFHPTDGQSEHTFATAMVKKNCKYANIQVSYTVLDYKPTKKTHAKFQALLPYSERKLNKIDLEALKKIKFGFGLSRGGMHTWLYSLGLVYEVHWDKIGPDLYDKTKIENFKWLSNLVVVPPDANALLTMSATKCVNR